MAIHAKRRGGGDSLLCPTTSFVTAALGQSKLSLGTRPLGTRNAASDRAKSRFANRQKLRKTASEAAADVLFQ